MSHLAQFSNLAGRNIVITGGGTGIGASIVSAFARQKAVVHFVDIDEAASRKLVDELIAESSEHCVILTAATLAISLPFRTAFVALSRATGRLAC